MIILAVSIIMLMFGIKLRKSLRSKDRTVMVKLIRTGCYIMECLQLLACIAGLGLTVLYLITTREERSSDLANILVAIPGLILGLFCLFLSLMVQGVRETKADLVLTNIIFKIFLFLTCTAIGVAFFLNLSYPNVSFTFTVIIDVILFLLFTFLYFYSNGFVLLYYNIILNQNTKGKF